MGKKIKTKKNRKILEIKYSLDKKKYSGPRDRAIDIWDLFVCAHTRSQKI